MEKSLNLFMKWIDLKILGVSAFYHDSAAALVIDGDIIAASQEERFSRVKHDKSFPENAIDSVLQTSNITAKDIDMVVFYESPEKKFDRIVNNAIHNFPRSLKNFRNALSRLIRHKADIRGQIRNYFEIRAPDYDWDNKIRFCDHHLSHAASAFYPSPFFEAAILTVDGVGEWTTAAIYRGYAEELMPIYEIHYPHSLGLLYSSFTQYLGFKVNSGEYKVMGLAPYGIPKYTDLIREYLINIQNDGSFHLNLKYFDFPVGERMINERFIELFGFPEREPESPLSQFHADVACSIQKVTEEVMLKLSRTARITTESSNLVLAGGVALNCVANGLILKECIFNNLWIQPAASDAGGALGAALLGAKQSGDKIREHLMKTNNDAMKGAYIGPEFSDDEIEKILLNLGARFTSYPDEERFLTEVVQHIANNKVVGWFQGRMEFGPRALGARSILGNPMALEMQSHINSKIKYRESFRPFAPSVLKEDCAEFFEIDTESPYMLLVAPIIKEKRLIVQDDKYLSMAERLKQRRSALPAITHVDFSARIQTVDGTYNAKYYQLLKKFKELTNCPILINTSFNVRGEPIVCTPEDAFRCFMRTEMDVLAIGKFILLKSEQLQVFKKLYKRG